MIEISQETLVKLRLLQDKTGLTPRQVLLLAKDEDFPSGLKYHHINKWLSGDIDPPPKASRPTM